MIKIKTVFSITILLVSQFLFAEDESLKDGLYAKILTTKGEIILSLEFEKTPMTVINFSGLAEGKIKNIVKPLGTPYYDGIIFHRVIPNFMIQGGDPTGTGRGGPGYSFPDEFDSSLKHNTSGILSMANAGPATNGSQFFITHVATPHLDGKHTVLGHVIKGQDVVNSINIGDKIKTVKIIRIGKKANEFKNDEEAFIEIMKKVDAEAVIKREKQLQHALNLKKNKEEAENEMLSKLKAKYPNSKTTESGLMYVVNKKGEGAKPKKNEKVTVHYIGYLLDGKKFQSTVDLKRPFTFPVGVGAVIPGWDEALLEMKVGEKRTLILSPDLAYGNRSIGNLIPASSWLIFEIELLEINN